ncbi:MAG: hypothetical protein VKI83_10615 [Synechococcaceae cyanobacterium]|nr:hypothetical protein [Synechococcaceae cyanobacterium]
MAAANVRRPLWRRKRWLTLGVPVAGLTVLVAIAPPLPESKRSGALSSLEAITSPKEPFRYQPDDEVFALDVDPRQVRLDLLEGWDKEQEAYRDTEALAFVSGPMYERHLSSNGHEITVPLGDLKLGPRVWRGRNRTAARQRAFIGIRHDGRVDFGYGELTPQRAALYESFIGGLHSIVNELEAPPPQYRGAYSISMGQQIRYFLPRIRMLFGQRRDGRLEVLMSRDGLTLEQTRDLARRRGLLAAYLPDHASKSRFIIPGVKGFSEQDANWISGGATSFVHVPYMLRLSSRSVPLQGNLIASLTPRAGGRACGTPWQCGRTLGGQLLDRALAGLNRLMEEGVQPVARLIWGAKGAATASRSAQRAPLREPPITADPLALRQLQQEPISVNAALPNEAPPLPPDLPEPELLEPGETLPIDEPSEPAALEPEQAEPTPEASTERRIPRREWGMPVWERGNNEIRRSPPEGSAEPAAPALPSQPGSPVPAGVSTQP